VPTCSKNAATSHCTPLPFLVILNTGGTGITAWRGASPTRDKASNNPLNIIGGLQPDKAGLASILPTFSHYSPRVSCMHSSRDSHRNFKWSLQDHSQKVRWFFQNRTRPVQNSQANKKLGNFEVNFLYAVSAPRPDGAHDSGMTRASGRLAAASHRTGFVPQLPSGQFGTLRYSHCLHVAGCTALCWTT
jgi:hypothetical protein